MSDQLLEQSFFSKDPFEVAKNLVGKVLCHKVSGLTLMAKIIETEAYYADEPGSHSSKGITPSKEALYMSPGTFYMYYSRGKDSLGFSVGQPGDGILIKSAVPYAKADKYDKMLQKMHAFNPINGRKREDHRLCSGQTLLCTALNIKVTDWNKRQMDKNGLYVVDTGYTPKNPVRCKRLGIPENRNHKALDRVVDLKYIKSVTKSPLSKGVVEGVDYLYIA